MIYAQARARPPSVRVTVTVRAGAAAAPVPVTPGRAGTAGRATALAEPAATSNSPRGRPGGSTRQPGLGHGRAAASARASVTSDVPVTVT